MARLTGRGAKPGPTGPVLLNAPQFRRLLDSLSLEKRSVVLDFGPARAETVALLTRFRCRLEIVELAQHLDALNGETDRAVLREKAAALLPPARDEPFDLVLCWDLLNYLQRPALTAVMNATAARMRPGGFAHLLIVYSSQTMPETPCRYAPLEDGRLLETATSATQVPAPRYSPEDLGKALGGLRPESATLLKNGMQEFLYRA